jgi:hypothetical protein
MTFAKQIGVAGIMGVALTAWSCGSEAPPEPAPAEAPAEPAATTPAAPATPDRLSSGIVLALAQFVEEAGKPVPGPARLEFLYRRGGAWRMSAMEDPESNVFHKAMAYPGEDGPVLLTMGGTQALVKTWTLEETALVGTEVWRADFGGKFSRMRDAEVADLYGNGEHAIAVATHDQGVVAVLRPSPDGFSVVELDSEKDIFVHEIEVGDVDGDGKIEVYATPSEPNRLDGSAQSGAVVRYVPEAGEGRVVVADLGDRHAKEILVEDVDGDGTDELYVAVEGHVGEFKELTHPVEIRRYDADTPPASGGVVIATIEDRLTRFLTAGDIDGDGRKEMIAATFSSGLWLLRPGVDPKAEWSLELIDKNSGGFEHASILTDLDGDGSDELYVASDKQKEVRRYAWDGEKLAREVIYVRPDDRPIFTWNLMPVPTALIPGA